MQDRIQDKSPRAFEPEADALKFLDDIDIEPPMNASPSTQVSESNSSNQATVSDAKMVMIDQKELFQLMEAKKILEAQQ